MDENLIKDLLSYLPRKSRFNLVDYARYSLLNRSYPGLVKKTNTFTEGIIYHNLSTRDIKILDEYEGAEYARLEVLPNMHTYLYIASKDNIINVPWKL